MQEALLHYIWKSELFEQTEYTSDTGEIIEIIYPGQHNSDAGPDFTNARIKINETIWAGNVEIHVKASDWQIHRHQENPAYDNTILHVVDEVDGECITSSGRKVPTITLNFNHSILKKYHQLMLSDHEIRCAESLPRLDLSLIPFWLSALAVERLQQKTQSVRELLQQEENSWEETFYIHLARSFGLKTNSLPFEMLAKSTPLKIVAKHANSLFQLEALFFGQAGFLSGETEDDYQQKLHDEYVYLQKMHQLKSLGKHIWKFMRLRPSNFPTLRIAEFCALIHHSRGLFSRIIECEDIQELHELLDGEVSEYWKQHYVFGKSTKEQRKALGKNAKDLLIINSIIPFTFVFGDYKNNEALKEKALRFLEAIAAEKNHIINEWSDLRVPARHAADSQALIHLKQNYCIEGSCLDCQIGNLILKN